MSSLQYLDIDGTVNFTFVPWQVLHDWLSELNGNIHVIGYLRDGVNRGQVLEELEARRRKGKKVAVVDAGLKALGRDRGFGNNWREYENEQGFTHLEELLIYQPKDWRKQAREYLFRFNWNLHRKSANIQKRTFKKEVTTKDGALHELPLFIESLIHAVLFHPELKRSERYEPLNFLLAYGVSDPIPQILDNVKIEDEVFKAEVIQAVKEELSPLDYFFDFQKYVHAYSMETLRDIGNANAFPRLCLIKELDFSDVVGQRLAKQVIRQEVVRHIWNRSIKDGMCSKKQPLSMIFAGPSGVGKTELALWLSKLMNKPGDDAFLKVDCGKLTTATELFGRSGAYQGAHEGSSLNNFIIRMSQAPSSLGIVLLDEIEKVDREAIYALYQVLDKGEWTNKQLVKGKSSQTETIPCHDIVFIMTTNAADAMICERASKSSRFYTARSQDEIEEITDTFESLIRSTLMKSYPFTDAFMGRVGRIIPFLPMAKNNVKKPNQHPLMGEMITVAKLLIEREQEKLSVGRNVKVGQYITTEAKHSMASIIVENAIEEAGVRSIQLGVERKMGDKILHSLCLEKGGIKNDSSVRYSANEQEQKIHFRVEQSGFRNKFGEEPSYIDDDLFG